MEKIDPAELVPMDVFEGDFPLRVDLVYARTDNFTGIPVYRREARLWLREDMAAVVLLAAQLCHARTGYIFLLYDGLRTVTAQKALLDTEVVRANPHWTAESTRMLSLPGMGGHPRGLAIDLSLGMSDGKSVPMGTAFDELSPSGNSPDVNKAHRDYRDLPDDVKANRKVLEDAMRQAAALLEFPLLPLPVEWWDFRVPAEISNGWAPLSDEDLPPQMRMTAKHLNDSNLRDFPHSHFKNLKKKLKKKIQPFL